MQCLNQMKQLGLALANYESGHGVYPPSGVGHGTARYAGGGDAMVLNLNGIVLLFPFLDLQAIWDRWNFNACASSAVRNNSGAVMGDPVTGGNAALEAKSLPVLICPTDNGKKTMTYSSASTASAIYGVSMTATLSAGKTCYDFLTNQRGYYYFNYWKNNPGSDRRMFGENSATSVAMILDGMSNTLAMAERTLEVFDGSPAAWGYRANAMIGLDLYGIYCKGINRWDDSSTPTYVPVPGKLGVYYAVGSQHPGGAHMLVADGSARFFQENTDVVALKALQTIAGGETVQVP